MPIGDKLARQGVKLIAKESRKFAEKGLESGWKRFVQSIMETGGEGIRAFKRLDEIQPETIWRPIYGGQHNHNIAEAFYNATFRDAAKAGIKEGSQASQTFFKIFNEVDRSKLYKNIEKAVPQKYLEQLTAEQKEFVSVFAKSVDGLGDIHGLPKDKRIAAYVPHIREESQQLGYLDMENYLSMLKRKPQSGKAFDPFIKKRSLEGDDVIEDFVKVMKVYTRYGLRKGYKEPVAKAALEKAQIFGMKNGGLSDKEILKSLDKKIDKNVIKEHLASYNPKDKYSITEFNELGDFLQDWMGKKRPKFPKLENAMNKLVNFTYAGTLFGNVSAAAVNLTQILTATLPEYGILPTTRGLARAFTKKGIREFTESNIMADLTHGAKINYLDFFKRVEYWNRLVSYHTGKMSAERLGKSGIDAVNAGFDAVRKTQFFAFGPAETPKIIRSLPRPITQFAQYPLNMAKLMLDWANPVKIAKNPKHIAKLMRWGGISVALGGPNALLPTDGIMSLLLGEKWTDKSNEMRQRYSLSGLIGVNLAPRFGAGIFPFLNTEYGIPLPPVLDAVKNLTTLALGKGGIMDRVLSEELDFSFERDFIQSKFVQRSLPTLVKGGVQVKKIVDALDLPTSGYTHVEGNVFNKKTGELIEVDQSVADRIKRATIGTSLKSGQTQELLSRERKRSELSRTGVQEHIKLATDALTARDNKKFRNEVQRLAELGVIDGQRMKQLLWREILRRSLERKYRYLKDNVKKQDRPRFLEELQKIEAQFNQEGADSIGKR